MMQFFS